MNFKRIMTIFVIFALLFSCATMKDNKTSKKKNSYKYTYSKNDKTKYNYKSIKNKNNIVKNNKKSNKNFASNSKFMKSLQKFGKGISDFSYSIWKAIVKFFGDSYSFIAKQISKISNTKTMKNLNKTWD